LLAAGGRTLEDVANCTHGFPQGQCLICSTLARSGSHASATQVAEKPAPARELAGNGPTPSALQGYPAPSAKPSSPGEAEKPRRGRHHLVTVVLVVVVGVLAFALFQGVLGLALRVAEYVAVALLAGWVGYRFGHWRGRRESRRP
jgi:Flp pilus assembly protein TadB